MTLALTPTLTHQVGRPSVVEEEVRVVADLPQLHEDVAQPLAGGAPDALQRENLEDNNVNITGFEHGIFFLVNTYFLCMYAYVQIPQGNSIPPPPHARGQHTTLRLGDPSG